MKALKKWFPLISLVAGVLALVCILMACVKSSTGSASGLEVCFGKKEEMLKFSIMNLLPYVLAIAGGVVAFLGAKKGNKIMAYVAIACFAVAAVFFFMATNFVTWDNVIPKEMQKEMNKALDLGIGSILAAIFSLLGAVAVVLDTFVVKE